MIRQAEPADIGGMQIVRRAVKENALSHQDRIKDNDYITFITTRGNGWVYETVDGILGFAIADLQQHNVWALFVHPDAEKRGIGKALQKVMLDWYFCQTNHTLWLSTSPETRAATFYAKSGWRHTGMHGSDELRFEMTARDWEMNSRSRNYQGAAS